MERQGREEFSYVSGIEHRNYLSLQHVLQIYTCLEMLKKLILCVDNEALVTGERKHDAEPKKALGTIEIVKEPETPGVTCGMCGER